MLVVRDANGRFSNPAFVTLTSGSLGWQFGAQSSDVVLVFANERSVQNIQNGRFTMGGDASVVAGPLGRNATVAATFAAVLRLKSPTASAERSLVSELRDHRNKWAHQQSFSGDDALVTVAMRLKMAVSP